MKCSACWSLICSLIFFLTLGPLSAEIGDVSPLGKDDSEMLARIAGYLIPPDGDEGLLRLDERTRARRFVDLCKKKHGEIAAGQLRDFLEMHAVDARPLFLKKQSRLPVSFRILGIGSGALFFVTWTGAKCVSYVVKSGREQLREASCSSPIAIEVSPQPNRTWSAFFTLPGNSADDSAGFAVAARKLKERRQIDVTAEEAMVSVHTDIIARDLEALKNPKWRIRGFYLNRDN